MAIEFTKMHGLGNDYFFIDAERFEIEDPAELSRQMSHRHLGAGADGIILILPGTDEADFTNYARKTGLTGTITVDNTNDRVDVDLPDQTFTAAGGASNNTLTKAIVAYEETAADTGRIPLSHHDFATTTDGNDLIAEMNAAGFGRAA